MSTNADGFHSSGRERPDGQTRIALMGDSTVFGWGVNDAEHRGSGRGSGGWVMTSTS